MYTIERDTLGWSLLYDGYALYKGLSFHTAENMLRLYTSSPKPFQWW